MKAGISTWNERVSPVMDTSVMVVVYEVDGGDARKVTEIDMSGMSQKEKIGALSRSGIELLVCGAISNDFMRRIRGAGIEMIPWVSGSNEMISRALSEGYLGPTEFLMPGCVRRQCRAMGRRVRADGRRRAGKKEGQEW
ncbi:MAG TPA: hypothetical protein VLA34_08730 [Candidatus Krumholzibacterium sp.]|nr:hypothetical protein [Candidatus Krumholzibacterium sp.]